MRAVVQRVSQASVTVEGNIVGQIERGLLIYVGVAKDDTEDDLRYIAEKITSLRIFTDEQGKMNLSVRDVAGGLLVISAFALQADARKGRRPSFDQAAEPTAAAALYEKLCESLAAQGLTVARGVFRAHMEVSSINDGPISILLDSTKLF